MRGWVLIALLLLFSTATIANEQRLLNESTTDGEGRWHPDKGILNPKDDEGDASQPPATAMAAAVVEDGTSSSGGAAETATTPLTQSGDSSSSNGNSVADGITNNAHDNNPNDNQIAEIGDTGDDPPGLFNTTTNSNATIIEEDCDPFLCYDENNTVEVSVSLALPLIWNLTSGEHDPAVESLVDGVATAATRLFQSTLDYAIEILDGPPTATSSQDDGVSKDADNPEGMEKPHNQRASPPTTTSSGDQRHGNSSTSDSGTIDSGIVWVGNHTGEINQTSRVNSSAIAEDYERNENNEEEKEEQPSSSGMWDWLELTPMSKEELYMMVLEFLEIEDEEDWHRATQSSPLLRDLKAEIRQAIYEFLLSQQEDKQNNHANGRNNSTSHHPNSNTTWGNHTGPSPATSGNGTSHQSDYYHYDNHNPSDGSGSTGSDGQSGFQPSGLWEMFLADTKVQLVEPSQTYAWWKLTMIYPVYVHYQASYTEVALADTETVELVEDRSDPQQQQQPGAVNVSQPPDADDGGTVAPSSTDSAGVVVTKTAPYWVPVTDQGTLDFISRLLQSVLKSAVESGAFLSSLTELASMQDAYMFDASASANDIVEQIMALVIPGMEYTLHEFISPYEVEEEVAPEAVEDVAEDAPREIPPPLPPWETGTYTHGLLDSDGEHSSDDEDSIYSDREQMGVWLLSVTMMGASGMVFLSILRNLMERRALEKARQELWLLGTEQDVADLLRVGWRQYSVPTPGNSQPEQVNNNSSNGGHRTRNAAQVVATVEDTAARVNGTVQGAEVIEVFDKSRDGYYDNDSMLHGSAMQQSVGYDSSSEVWSSPIETDPLPPSHQFRNRAMYSSRAMEFHMGESEKR